MSLPAHASAPGKLFLFGEYAVLCGGWSVILSSDRQVHVHHDPAHQGGYEVCGADLSLDTRLPRAAMRAIGEDEASVDVLTADLSELYHRGAKLGLGSSAASTIASMLAVCPELLKTPVQLFERAFHAHREIQQGRGSGGDVASAAFGGVIGYQLKAAQAPFELIDVDQKLSASHVTDLELVRLVREVTLPSTLRIEAIWTRMPASSTSLIKLVESARSTHPALTRHTLQVLAECGAAALTAMLDDSSDATSTLCALAHDVDVALTRFSEELEIPIVTPQHRALAQAAKTHGIACKISGAGGGDFSLLLGPQAADWDAMLARLPDGVEHVPLMLGQHTPSVCVGE